jgi:hypothetical protein
VPEKKRRQIEIHKTRFAFPPEEVFRLFCPVREDEWIPGWREQRQIVYTESGFAEQSCVFFTNHQPHLTGLAVWVNNVFQPPTKIQYSAVNNDLVYQIQADLTPLADGCEVTLQRTFTALTPKGEEFLGQMVQDAQKAPPKLFELMQHYLRKGKAQK